MSGAQSRMIRCLAVLVFLLVLFCAAVVWNINTGSVDISLKEIIRIIF